jgi:hypothetical protein
LSPLHHRVAQRCQSGNVRYKVVFCPLIIGEVAQRHRETVRQYRVMLLSPTHHRGSRSTPEQGGVFPLTAIRFCPLIIGEVAQPCPARRRMRRHRGKAFCPLIIGEVAQRPRPRRFHCRLFPSVPSSSGKSLNLVLVSIGGAWVLLSPHHRGSRSTTRRGVDLRGGRGTTFCPLIIGEVAQQHPSRVKALCGFRG